MITAKTRQVLLDHARTLNGVNVVFEMLNKTHMGVIVDYSIRYAPQWNGDQYELWFIIQVPRTVNGIVNRNLHAIRRASEVAV